MDFAKINFITQQFFINSQVLNVDEVNIGLINKTYIVEYLLNGSKSKFILQSLSNIFESYELVNINHKLITEHIDKKLNDIYLDYYHISWRVPNLIKCKSNNLFVFPFESNIWRAMIYIDKTFSTDLLEDEIMAYETGIGLAKFHLFCSGFDCSKLKKGIKNFHNTKYYIDQFIFSVKCYDFKKLDFRLNKKIKYLICDISNHIRYVEFLFSYLNNNSIKHNVIHGDPKLSNFLFDNKDKYVVSLIDLDTISSGYLLTDIADCIRSICNLAGEDPKNIENVCFDINSCMYFLSGYFSISNKNEDQSFEFIPEFIYLIIFELTIRFLTDFLQSNRYFKIKYKNHNLYRAEVQYRLFSSFLSNISNFSAELQKFGFSSSSNFVSDVEKFV
tara:strand:+ start:2471 stop:3634 length:1164 start_codon:yes stop_codon:yes gene_type:complete